MSDNKRKAIASMSVYSCSIDRPRGGRWDGEMDVLLGSSLGAMAVLAMCSALAAERALHTSRELTGGSASTFWIVAADEDYDEEGNGDRDVMSCTDAALGGLDRQTPYCTNVAQKQSLCRRRVA